MKKFATAVVAIGVITFSSSVLAKDNKDDSIDYFDPHSTFEVVLTAPILEAGAKKAASGDSKRVKRKSLAGSSKNTLAAAH